MKTRKRMFPAIALVLAAALTAASAAEIVSFETAEPDVSTPVLLETRPVTGTPEADRPGTKLPSATPGPETNEPEAMITSAPATDEPITPEPPPPVSTLRPTAPPTEPPSVKVIDHINNPKVEPDFYFQKGSKLLEIWFPNIKDADAAILRYDGQVYMIDCGDLNASARTVLLIKQLGIESIDEIFNSHPHHDHIEGLGMTDNAARVKSLRICFPPDSTVSGMNMMDVAGARNIPVSMFKDGDVFTMGDGKVSLTFLKNDSETLDMNSQSAITMVRYGDCSMLFMADMERDGQEAMFGRIDPDLLKSDILKYPHHGKSAMQDAFYKAVNPDMVIVTSQEGRRSDLGQNYLHNRGVSTVYTSVKGLFVRLLTDGKNWLCDRVPVTVE